MFKNNILKNLLLLMVLGCMLLPLSSLEAAMKSNSYIIYDSVMHTFDGPIISNVNHSVSNTTATVTWDTDIIADAFVIYDTDSNFSDSKEQGSTVKNSTSHTVEVTGLEPNTAYYYQVRSERINGGITTDTTLRTFTSGDRELDPDVEEQLGQSSGGGGILIIDKQDKAPPLITNLSISNVTTDAAEISWETDEEATEFVEYGGTTAYGAIYGAWSSSTIHTVRIENLESNAIYHFRAISSDSWGNVGYSEDFLFTTVPGAGEEEEDPTEAGLGEEDDEPIIIPEAQDILSRLFPDISLTDLTSLQSIDDLSRFINTPILSGEPIVDVSATQATITWSTDIESDSFIALAPDSAYIEGADEPYQMVIGNDELVTVHEVTLYNLTPDTDYHFQLRSKARLGPTARSEDYTFRTSIEELQIVSYFTQIVDNQTAIFRWVTNKEADTAVTFSPYLGGLLAVDQSKTIKDNAFSVIHEITVTDFVAGTFYDIELRSADASGNIATKILPQFSTSEDDFPPTISHIKADSTVFVDRSNKIQTIISWLTNEPATSRVYFQEGVHGATVELSESTNLNTNYTKEHVIVITKFKPGVVYSFRAESIDSTDNVTISKVHTFMTAKKKESIIQIIMNILENTFGWLTRIIE